MRGQGKKIREIARELKRAPSTISRELKRGRCWRHPYLPSRAQKRYEKRRKNCGRAKKLSDAGNKRLVRELIEERQWSPEQISHRLKQEGHELTISTTTIYRAIHAGLFDGPNRKNGHKRKVDLFTSKLRRKGKKYRKDGQPRRQSQFTIDHRIEERPEMATLRLTAGHFEADTVAGKRNTGRIVSLVDRKSRYTLASKVEKAEAQIVSERIIEMLDALPEDLVKTVTPDRGREFAFYRTVTEALPHVTFYFANPHSPWERGTNENTNGLLREYFPKGCDMLKVTEKQLQEKIVNMNLRPRKCLDWKTPYEVFFNEVLHLT